MLIGLQPASGSRWLLLIRAPRDHRRRRPEISAATSFASRSSGALGGAGCGLVGVTVHGGAAFRRGPWLCVGLAFVAVVRGRCSLSSSVVPLVGVVCWR